MRHSVILLLCCAAVGCMHQTASTFINPGGLPTPRGYTHAVVVPRGRTIYLSGQIPLNEKGELIGKGNLREQTAQVFRNLQTVLKAAQADLSDVVKLTIYLRDISQIGQFREARDQFFRDNLPASSLVEVKGLVQEDILIEIDAIAAPRGPLEQ